MLLPKGKRAPFSGFLVHAGDIKELAKNALRLKVCGEDKAELAVRLKTSKKSVMLHVDLGDKRLTGCMVQVTTLSDRLTSAGQIQQLIVPWYEHPAFVTMASVIVTGVVIGTITYLAMRPDS